jgi:penicillin-binding protein 1C
LAASLAAAVLLFFFLDLLFPFPWETLRRSAAVEVTDRHGEPLRLFLPADERWRLPVALDELPEDLVKAVVASEDRRFFHHPGVDPLAVVRAAWSNLAAGRVVSGASTIPMQIARMAEPRRRTLGAKLLEAFRALQLDAHRSKRELLRIYLDLAPYGGNLEGVGAACRFYFGKPPARLSLGEIALLVTLPRSPNGYDPVRRPEAARAARDRVLAQLAEGGVISGRQAAEARRQPLPRRLHPVPFEAPHLSRWVAARAGAEPVGGSHRLVTTLDLRLQRSAEEQVRRRIGGLRGRGIGNAAAVVLDNETRAVLAWVGSAGFGETLFAGQVDGVLARRSPGSTLKPFLYALAFDDGGLIPDSWLLDVPRDWAGYVPENYDGRYRGRVTAREALVESLNAPAVALLARVGLGRFHALLRRGGLATLDRPPERYGLPLILGAAEVTLADLANLYASLAEDGLFRPWRVLRTELEKPRGPGERLVSPEAARQVATILTGLEHPDLPAGWHLARGVPAVAWKTGTSYGHRDAWAVGFSRRHTVGVWVGNFDGTPIYGISGARDAAPLLFDLLRAVESGTGELGAGTPLGGAPPRRPAETLEVCAESRLLPTPYCPRTLGVPYLPGRTRLPSCTVHRRVFVDAETGRLLAGDCLGSRPRRVRVLTLYPPELLAWWRSRSQPVPEIPEPEPGCGGAGVTEPPKIVSPDSATPYRLRRDAPGEFQRVPLVARAAGRLFWYQDGRLVASGPPEAQTFLPLERGRHRLVVVDETGRVDRVDYRVESWDSWAETETPHR